MAIRGRPRKHREPLVKRHFDLPKSINDRLVTDQRDAVEVVRHALAREYGLLDENEQSSVSGMDAILREIRELRAALQTQTGGVTA